MGISIDTSTSTKLYQLDRPIQGMISYFPQAGYGTCRSSCYEVTWVHLLLEYMRSPKIPNDAIHYSRYLDRQWIFHSTPISPKIQKHAIFLKSTVYSLKSFCLHLNLYRLLEVCKSDFGVGTIGFQKGSVFKFFCNRMYYEKSVLSLFICCSEAYLLKSIIMLK